MYEADVLIKEAYEKNLHTLTYVKTFLQQQQQKKTIFQIFKKKKSSNY